MNLLWPFAFGMPLLLGCGAETGEVLAAGWSARLDEPDATIEPSRFVAVDGGIEVRHGPNATLWHPSHRAKGIYRLSADITHLDSGFHPHGAGLVFGGSHVTTEGQSYTYFLVRGDGHFLIKLRNGAKTEEVVGWSEHETVSREDKKGVSHNQLMIEVGGKETRFLINSVEVHRARTASLHTDGQYGFRLVHDLHVRFGKPLVEALNQ